MAKNLEATDPYTYFQDYREFIPDYEDFIEALRVPNPVSIRINILLATPEQVVSDLERRGVKIEPTPLGDNFWTVPECDRPGRLFTHLLGMIYPQSLSSGIPALVLRPGPGDFVLDLCAAPGSKTGHMAQMMENRGTILANDPSTKRHSPLQNNLRRLGVANAIVSGYAGQNFPKRWRFSKILADVPCTGEGNGRIGPSGRLTGFRVTAKALTNVQTGCLLRAFDVLAPGGALVYSTCTYNPTENEAVVDYLLKERPSAELLPIDLDIPHEPGIVRWKGETYDERLELAWRIYPHRLKSEGFFLAHIART